MPASFEEILKSRIFKFTVGQNVDGKPTTFSVHEEAIAALSQPLHALMRSGLSESESGHAIWEDVSKDTFIRFTQFAYTGDYSVPALAMRVIPAVEDDVIPGPEPEPEFTIALDSEPGPSNQFEDCPPAAEETVPEPMSDWGSFGSVRKMTKKEAKKKVKVLDVFSTTPLPLLSARNMYEDTCEPSSAFKPWCTYSSSFTSHASLWILGDYRHIESLKALALHKLHKTLCAFELYSQNVEDVIDLVRCAYSDEGAGLGEGMSGLRRLVCQYLAMNKTLLCQDDGFMDLLGEGGQFVKDFFKYSTA
ncbi:hypothetical protein ACEPPN_010076 [Leptodophora sp. 'Broadleaf-Isolate-01']